jgi:hypothetical protein
MSFLRTLESRIGMLQRLFGMLVSGLVIFFPVVRGGNTVGVCCEIVQFCGSLVCVFCHGVSHPRFTFHPRTIPLRTLCNIEQSMLTRVK